MDGVGLMLTPISFRDACNYTGYHHRHSSPPQGHKFSIGLESNGELVGVAIAGRPISPSLDDGLTMEVRRVTTNGAKNACSMLYGAAARASFAMGFRKVITYTLQSETGASLKGAGFIPEYECTTEARWAMRANRLQQLRLDGRDTIPQGNKVRWVKFVNG